MRDKEDPVDEQDVRCAGDGRGLSPRRRTLRVVGLRAHGRFQVRDDLVQRLRGEIAAGTYRPSGQQVAGCMLIQLGNIFQG